MGVFDQILADIPAEDRVVLDKYPQLKQTVENLETQHAAAKTRNEKWDQWAERNWDRDHSATRNELAYQQQLTEAQQRVADLEASGGVGDMTFDEVIAAADKRYLTKDNVVTAVEPIVRQVREDSKKDLNSTATGFEHVFFNVIDLPVRHFQEFGKPMDAQAFKKFLYENNGFGDPRASYDRFVATEREAARVASEKKQSEDWEAKATARETAAAAKAREETLRESAMRKLPTDQGGVDRSEMGTIQRKQLENARGEDGSLKIPDNVKVGDGILAALGAEMAAKGQLTGETQQ